MVIFYINIHKTLTNKRLPVYDCVDLFTVQVNLATVHKCSSLIRLFRRRDSSPSADILNETDRFIRDYETRYRRNLPPTISFETSKLSASSLMKQFLAHRRCLDNLDAILRSSDCSPIYRNLCVSKAVDAGRTLVVAKVIRAGFCVVEEALRRIPDLSVIHLVRDPRAIAVSRYKQQKMWDGSEKIGDNLRPSLMQLAMKICVRMVEDLRVKRRIEEVFPGAVMTVKYEDFIADPRSTVDKMFQHVGHILRRDTVDKWIATYVTDGGQKNDGGPFDIFRKNPVLHASSWRNEVNDRQKGLMDEHCRLVLDELHYTP